MFTLDEILQATKGKLLRGNPRTSFSGISTDSRTIGAGELFVALKGERFDGHDFAQAAVQGGARGVLVEHPCDRIPPSVPVIAVPDTLVALGQIAAWHRKRFPIHLVAVTGSVGKTTTKEFIAAALALRHHVLKSKENFNNEIGVPLTLLQLEKTHSAAVLELAMRATGQIRYLTEIANPTIGVITNIGESHLGMLGSLEGIARAKGELVANMGQDGVVVLNADDPWFGYLSSLARCRVVSFGFADTADFSGREVRIFYARGENGEVRTSTEFVVRHGKEVCLVRLPAGGEHYAANALAAIAAAACTGMQLQEIARGLATTEPLKMRQQWLSSPGGYLILNDAYNSSPASLRAALRVTQFFPCEGKRIAVLGDIKELGESSTEIHRQLGRELPRYGVDLLCVIGEFAEDMAAGAREAGLPNDKIIVSSSLDELIVAVRERASRGDVLLVKASRAMQLERVVEALMERG